MTPFFGSPAPIAEEDAPPAAEPIREESQTLSVAALENDKGVKTATYNSIQNSLYDLADTRSRTNKLVLPNGTEIRLASSTSPNRGAYNATYEVTAKGGEPQIVQGNTAATDLAHKCDLLSLTAKERASLMKLSEGQLHERARGHLPKLQEKQTHVSGYVTKNGRHVGAYSQVRTLLAKLKQGETLHFPEGIKASRHESGFKIESKMPGKNFDIGRTRYVTQADGIPHAVAAKEVLNQSAKTPHEKSIGGSSKHESFDAANQAGKKSSGSGSGPSAAEANARVAKAGKKRGPDSYAGQEARSRSLQRPEVTPGLNGPGEAEAHRAVGEGKSPTEGKMPASDITYRRATGKELHGRAASGDKTAQAEIDRRASRRASKRQVGTGSRTIPGPRGPEKLPQGDPRKPAGTGFQKTPGGDAVRAKDLNTGDTINFEGHDWKVKQISGGGGKPVQSVNVVPIRSDGSEGSVARTLEQHEKINRVGKSKLGDLSGKGAVPGAKRITGGYDKPGGAVNSGMKGTPGASVDDPSHVSHPSFKAEDAMNQTDAQKVSRFKQMHGREPTDKEKKAGGMTGRKSHGLGWNPDDSPEDQAKGMTAGTNHTDPAEWKEMHQRLTRHGQSLKVDSLRAAWAHAKVEGDEKMAKRILETMKKAEGRSSKSSRLIDYKEGKGGAAATIDRTKRRSGGPPKA